MKNSQADQTLPINSERGSGFTAATLLGELWDMDEISKAKHVLSAVYEGVDCWLTIDEMRALEKRGLVTDVNVKPGRGRYAGRYEFRWADKLEALVEASRASSPNDQALRPRTPGLPSKPGVTE